MTFLNFDSGLKQEQLKTLLTALEMLQKNRKSREPFILTNGMMQSNLDLFVESLLEGKYVAKNE